MASVAYILMNILPRDTQHKYVIGFMVTYLSGQFIWAIMTDYGGFSMDGSTYNMILLTKLWGLSLSYRDGAVPVTKLTPEQADRRVMYMPNLLEYSSFVFFCCGCLTGPFIEYDDFINWITK
jgi:hypothetical protein